MATLTLPDPCLVVLVGAAGSGKSTFAARHFKPAEVLSSDAFRERVSGDPADQAATRPAFAALHRELALRLGHGALTVVDATNVASHARRELLRRATRAGIPTVAIVLDLPEAVILARNEARERVVPADAVRRQLADLRRSLRPGCLDAEGFASIVRLVSSEEVERTRMVRTRGPWGYLASGFARR